MGDGEADQFARAPESVGLSLGAKGPLFVLLARKGPGAPSDEKELPKGLLIVPKRTLSYRVPLNA